MSIGILKLQGFLNLIMIINKKKNIGHQYKKIILLPNNNNKHCYNNKLLTYTIIYNFYCL